MKISRYTAIWARQIVNKSKKSTVPRILVAAGQEETDVRYATGLAAPDPFCLLVEGSRLHLLVSALEASRARKTCPSAVLHTPAELTAGRAKHPSLSKQLLALVRKLGFRTVEVGPWFPCGMARALEAGGVTLRLTSSPPFPRRAIKTPHEIACIAKSQRAAVAAVRAAIQCIRQAAISPSGILKYGRRILTSEAIKDVIERTLLEHRAIASGTIVAVGPQGARPHDEGSGPVRAGVPIVLDVFPRSRDTGYWGDITRTVVRGRASDEIRRMHQTVFAAQKLAFSLLRPRVAARTVQRTVEECFRDRGYETRLEPPGRERGFIHGVGHGVGLDIHELPGLRSGPGRLAAGHVVTVEPGLYIPGLGGVRIEDTVVITRTGYKILAPCPQKLET